MKYFLRGVVVGIVNIVCFGISLALARYLDVSIFWAVSYGWIAGYMASEIARLIFRGAEI